MTTPWADNLAAWISLCVAAGINIDRIAVTRHWAQSEIDALQERRNAELMKPYMGFVGLIDDLIAGLTNLLTGSRPDRALYLCGYRMVFGPDDQDCGFHLIPRRDPLIFGACA